MSRRLKWFISALTTLIVPVVVFFVRILVSFTQETESFSIEQYFSGICVTTVLTISVLFVLIAMDSIEYLASGEQNGKFLTGVVTFISLLFFLITIIAYTFFYIEPPINNLVSVAISLGVLLLIVFFCGFIVQPKESSKIK